MADRRTPIQVPPRSDDEAPATAEQLQFIRQLVTGMSLSGFRFDYRKMGTAQAASVIDQLLQLRDASGMARPTKSGGGCMNALARLIARGVVTLIVAAVVLAGVGVGGYLIYQKINESPSDSGGSADSNDDTNENASDDQSRTGEIDFFGHKLPGTVDDAINERDTTDRNPTIDTPTPNPDDTRPTPGPPPTIDPATAAQLDELRLLLAKLKQFTRSEYTASIRGQSVAGMLKQLDKMPTLMNKLDPALAERVRAVITAYGDDALNAEAMRAQIDVLLDDLKAWGSRT